MTVLRRQDQMPAEEAERGGPRRLGNALVIRWEALLLHPLIERSVRRGRGVHEGMTDARVDHDGRARVACVL
eukprot:CAMPEP_0119431024 /NCGR_PEP_ID=MMETSP1335-20130426/45162_1 /TAXON_ID=259385 /ORGANISM="Chrysoculter rhomboideus, Strain RCC1486" /LENGTH=71 /DNA_ID=CAMNT_0007456807 /DNA_START=101 /DNA_END=316 /DNA_ORIENTATION=+